MNQKTFKYVIGLMSGTSLDGLDLAYIKFNLNNLRNFKIITAETIAYDTKWHKALKDAYKMSAVELARLDAQYGIYLGEQINHFIKRYHIDRVDLIASHGQTVFHRPESGYTTQIGNGAHINAVTGIKTVCDFRTQDVALGGQGAPLVPTGDRYLFGQYDYCLNIGGFANISFEENNKRLAYDICPANIVLNHYVAKTGLPYDDKGQIAESGKIHTALLDALNNLDFYQSGKPKSLGWEFVTEKILPLIDSYNLEIKDILKTYVEHIAIQIAKIPKKDTRMLVTGGGAHNEYLISRIKKHSDSKIVIPGKTLIDYKEALIFGLLGLLKELGKINVFSSVTGSSIDHSSGVIFDAFKSRQENVSLHDLEK